MVVCFSLVACADFLDKKGSSVLAVPESVKDLRAMLDDEPSISRYYPSLIEMGSDDYYVPYATLVGRPQKEQFIYYWQREEERFEMASWGSPYGVVMIGNIVLEALERGVEGVASEKKILEGEAYFVRALAYWYLAQVFCLPYDERTSHKDLGLPLRVSSDMNQTYDRSSVEEAYRLIVDGMKKAIELLPENTAYKTRPNKAAAYGALARVFLSMEKYDEANQMAIEAMKRHDKLLDYNMINVSAKLPFEIFHEEVVYYGATNNGLLLSASRARIPKKLFDLFEEDDLRKQVFFNTKNIDDIIFKGYYAGESTSYFAGIATDELYLIRAECEIRNGATSAGLSLLNKLIETRWKKGSFVPYQTKDEEEALIMVLQERRKQLIKRGLRWVDLRRLNKDSRFAQIIVRETDTGSEVQKFELEPNAIEYVYPIPYPVLELYEYEQNPI